MVDFDPEDLPDDVFAQPGDAIRVADEIGGAPRDLSAEQLAEQAEAIKLAAVRSEPRDVAIERGRRLGAHEAALRGETGQEAENRIKRAMAYAAWEYDGKPLAYSDRYHKEFKLKTIDHVHDYLTYSGPDQKKGKK